MIFYDLKNRKKVDSKNYQIIKKKTKRGIIKMARAKSKDGNWMYRILPK